MRKNVRRPAFEDACRTVARNLSESGTKVRVVFTGDGAATDGSTIYLPAGDQMSVMTPQECGVLAGYVDHEAEHIASTDMDLWNSTIGVADDFRRELANAVEDMRIEKIAVRKNPGTFANLSDTAENVCKQELEQLTDLAKLMPHKMQDKRFILPGAVTWEGRKRAGMHADLNEKLLGLVSPEIRKQAERINDMLKAARDGRKGTHDVWGIVTKLAGELEEEEKQQEEEEKKRKPKKGERRESDENEGASSRGDEATESEDDGNGEGDEANDDDDNDDGNKDGNDDDNETRGDAGDDSEGEDDAERSRKENGGKEAVTQTDSEAELEQAGGRGASLSGPDDKPKGETRKVSFTPVVHTNYNPAEAWVSYTTENDFVLNAKTGAKRIYDMYGNASLFGLANRLFNEDNIEHYDAMLQEMGPHINTMRAKLRRALMSKMERRWDGGYTSGRIDPRRLVDAVRGTPEVFRRRDPEQYMDTAVQIVVDLSASMYTNNRIRLAAQAAIAIANALEGTGVNYEVIGFQDPGLFGLSKELAIKMGDALSNRLNKPATFARYLPNMIVEFKPFEKRLRDCRAGMGGLAFAAGGANNDVDALLCAHERLIKRDETRKVMLVLSDGKPAPYSDFDENWVEQMFRKLVAQIEVEARIQIVGIGIESDCVRKFYKANSVLNAAEELPRTVIDQVARILLGSRFQIDNAKLLGAA